MQRTSVIKGTRPILFTAPHGFDDKKTDEFAAKFAKEMGAYAVINHYWQRADEYNYEEEHANCNNLDHCNMPVVKEEFLDKIHDIVLNKMRDEPYRYIFNLHGMADNKHNCHVVIGYGDNDPPRWSCSQLFAYSLGYHLSHVQSINVRFAKKGGKYSGAKQNNLNQLFSLQNINHPSVHSVQIEFSKKMRANDRFIGWSLPTTTLCAMQIDEAISVFQQNVFPYTLDKNLPEDFDEKVNEIKYL